MPPPLDINCISNRKKVYFSPPTRRISPWPSKRPANGRLSKFSQPTPTLLLPFSPLILESRSPRLTNGCEFTYSNLNCPQISHSDKNNRLFIVLGKHQVLEEAVRSGGRPSSGTGEDGGRTRRDDGFTRPPPAAMEEEMAARRRFHADPRLQGLEITWRQLFPADRLLPQLQP